MSVRNGMAARGEARGARADVGGVVHNRIQPRETAVNTVARIVNTAVNELGVSRLVTRPTPNQCVYAQLTSLTRT